MVKFKGFTLIELMIVVAIIGILASVIIGPATNKQDNNNNENDYSADVDGNTIMINGVLHRCDASGDCEAIN